MKKLLTFTLLLLTTITSQVKPVFERGSVYINKKTGQQILLLADDHIKSESTKEQRDQVIKELKKIKKESSITLVEDGESGNKLVHRDNHEYQLSRKFINSESKKPRKLISISFDNSPMALLHSDLTKENINVENIECRYMLETIIDEILLALSSEEIIYYDSKPKISHLSKEDFLNELEQNINTLKNQAQHISKQKHNYSEKEYSNIAEYFANYIKRSEIVTPKNTPHVSASIESINKIKKQLISILDSIQKPDNLNKTTENSLGMTIIQALTAKEQIPKLELSKIANEIMLNISRCKLIIDYFLEDYRFVDYNIIYNILKNYDKKIIVVCAGGMHTLNTEKFLTDFLDYKLIKKMGFDINLDNIKTTAELQEKLAEITQENNPPINVAELFKNLSVQDTQDKKS